MIKVVIEVEIDGMQYRYEKERPGIFTSSVIRAERTQEMLDEGYRFAKKMIESQK